MPELIALDLYSEPYAATGNIGDGGFRRLLGAPSLEGLQLVLREAVQNSCDAAKLGQGPSILIRLRTLSPEQVAHARQHVFASLPFIPESQALLEGFLASDTPRVLEICDFGTTGLGGPTRADRIPENTERTDFIDFLRNVGTQRNTELGGGTYGFGKASLYMASGCSTILVDTLARNPQTEERRIMACHLGMSGSRSTGDGYLNKFTGRHWWGVAGHAGEPTEPVTGDDAISLAACLGLPARGAGESGTTIMVLDPDLADMSAEAAGIQIVESLLWNFWPRMMENAPPATRLLCRVEVEGDDVPVPLPEHCPPLDVFARAMTMIRDKHPDVRKISSERPQKLLGHLAIVKMLRADRLPAFQREDSLLPPIANHIALMRPVELVVTHIEGAPLPDDRSEWAGVFITSADPAVEGAFARSEPAAHDAWDPSAFPRGWEKTWVTVALRRLKEAAAAVAAPTLASPGKGETVHPLAALSGRLGAFLDSGTHGGPRRSTRGGGGGDGSARRRVSRPEFERLQLSHGQRTALFRLQVTGAGRENCLVLTPAVAMDGSNVPAERLETGHSPTIVGITGPDSEAYPVGPSARIGELEGQFTVEVTVPDDCAIGLQAELVEGEAA